MDQSMSFLQSKGLKRIQVTRVQPETQNAHTFEILPLDGWKPVYEAGQFITLVFFTGLSEKRRSYSISSAPLLGEPLCITVKAVENGEFSRWLLNKIMPGDVLLTSGISGLFTLPEDKTAYGQYFFVAAGSGITPCFSLLKTILGTSNEKIVLIYSNRTQTDCIFYGQLQRLLKKYPERLVIYFLFSDRYDIYQRRLSHWLLEQLLDQYLTVPPQGALCYLCGPFDFMRTARISLLSRIPEKNIRKEHFSVIPPLIIPEPPDRTAQPVTIISPTGTQTLRVQFPQSVLDAALAANIPVPYSCKAGRCGSCVATCTRGELWMAYNEVLTDEDTLKGRVLLCQAYPVGAPAEVII